MLMGCTEISALTLPSTVAVLRQEDGLHEALHPKAEWFAASASSEIDKEAAQDS